MLRRDFVKTMAAAFGGSVRTYAQPRYRLADVVILIPGIMGSALSKDGKELWALSGGTIATALRTLGSSVSSLTLAGDSPEIDDLGDGVTATGLLQDLHLIPGFWKIDGYSEVSNYIIRTFDAQRGKNFFEFPYDWRRDNRVAARRLASSSRGWLNDWRRSSGNSDARMIVVAHSMGGLVARHFLEVLGGWKDTRMLITFGTPYRGSLNALDFLGNGIKKSVGPFSLFDISAMARSFTSIYQLLPIYECYDPGDGKLVRVGEITGIPNVDPVRAKAALAFHRSIQSAVAENEKNNRDYSARRYSLHPIIGKFQPTLQSGRRAGNGIQMLQTIDENPWRGDGTVPEQSGTPVETDALKATHRTVYVGGVHGSLQNSEPILMHMGGLFDETQRNTDRFRAPELNVALLLEDVYTTSDRITIRAQSEDNPGPLSAVVTGGDGQVVARLALEGPGSAAEGTLAPLGEGVYRVQVSGGPAVASVTDTFLVVRG